jgi:hypothetical protein
VRDAPSEFIQLATVAIGDGDRTDVEIRIDPFQVIIGAASPGSDALIEVAAGDKGLRSWITKICHAGELHWREVRRLVHHDLRAVEFLDRGEHTIAALLKGAANATVFQHETARLENSQ